MKTTEDIFDKCIQLSKASVQLGLDKNYELKNCRDIWKKEKWYSEEEVKEKFKQLKNYVGNSRFKISNESLQLFYEKVKELFGDEK
jgi:hypothetical protein